MSKEKFPHFLPSESLNLNKNNLTGTLKNEIEEKQKI